MTVAELITQLQTLPQDANCLIYSVDNGEWIALADVSYYANAIHLKTSFDIDD